MGAKSLGRLGLYWDRGYCFLRLEWGYTWVRFVCLSVCCVCLGLFLLFVVGPPSFFSFGSLCSGFLFLSAVSSWASGFLSAGRPRGFRVGSLPVSGFGTQSKKGVYHGLRNETERQRRASDLVTRCRVPHGGKL